MRHHVLFVDDEEEILKTLNREFRTRAFDASFATSGADGLKILQEKPAHIIIADMRMPEMDGVEFLGKTKEICPYAIRIVLSGYADMDMIMKVINEHSIWKYIAKPWNGSDLQFTVRDALELVDSRIDKKELLQNISNKNRELETALQYTKELNLQIVETNSRLETVVQQRTQQLHEALKRLSILDKIKNDFISLLSHELRTPLNGVFGISELIIDAINKTPDIALYCELYSKSKTRILNLLDDAFLLADIEVAEGKFPSNKIDFKEIVHAAITDVSEHAKIRDIRIAKPDNEMGHIAADEQLMRKAMCSLLKTAINVCPNNGVVILSCKSTANGLELDAITSGLTLSDKTISHFFEVLANRETLTPQGDWGLDPVLTHRIFSLFNGSVRIANMQPAGICISASLPVVAG